MGTAHYDEYRREFGGLQKLSIFKIRKTASAYFQIKKTKKNELMEKGCNAYNSFEIELKFSSSSSSCFSI